jgi:hypothetical protein
LVRSRSLFWVEQQHSCPKFHKPRTSTAGLLAPYTGNLHWWRDCIRDDLHHGSRCQRISLQIDDVDTWPPAICEMFRLKYVEMFIIFSNIHQIFFPTFTSNSPDLLKRFFWQFPDSVQVILIWRFGLVVWKSGKSELCAK